MVSLYGWMSTSPSVLIHSHHCDEFEIDDIGRYLSSDPTIRFVTSMWHLDAEKIAMTHDAYRLFRPDDAIFHLVNDASICEQLVSQGYPAHFVNSNAFLDERLFVVNRNRDHVFDAVYNARMSAFKRHHLAARIPQLLIIGGIVAPDDTFEYFQQVQNTIPHATFVHAKDNRHRSCHEVSELLNQARVGLCLSACEGAMFAATEYLLCGLPIVSTASKGGRDAWFDPEFSRIVPDDPQAVADAVAELIELKIPPEDIREATLKRMWEHRRRFIDVGQSAYSNWNVGREFARDFYTNFTHKMGEWRSPEDVMKFYELARCR